MKKRSLLGIALVLMLAMVLCLTACGKKGGGSSLSTSGNGGSGGKAEGGKDVINEISSNELLDKIKEQATDEFYTPEHFKDVFKDSFELSNEKSGKAEFQIFGRNFELTGKECATAENGVIMFDNGVADAMLYFGQYEKSFNEYSGMVEELEKGVADAMDADPDILNTPADEMHSIYASDVRNYTEYKSLLSTYFKYNTDFNRLCTKSYDTDQYRVNWAIYTADLEREDSMGILKISITPLKYADDVPMQFGAASVLIKGTDHIKSENMILICNGVKQLTGIDLMDKIYCCYDEDMQLFTQKYANLDEGEYFFRENIHKDENFSLGFKKYASDEENVYTLDMGKGRKLSDNFSPDVTGELNFEDYGSGTKHFYTDSVMDNEIRIYVDDRDQKLLSIMTDKKFYATDVINQLGEPAYMKCYMDENHNKMFSCRWAYGEYFITAEYGIYKDNVDRDTGKVRVYEIKNQEVFSGLQIRNKNIYTEEYNVPIKDQELDDWIHENMD